MIGPNVNPDVTGECNFIKMWETIKRFLIIIFYTLKMGAGATFDWLFFDNSKVVNFDD